jgi:mannose-1-phosphate guanylyltransferase
MKAFLLAAGHGTRLRPITDALPKCLVPIQGTPLLKIWLELCRAAGVEQILLNIHAHAVIVEDWISKNDLGGMQIRLSHEPVLLGSAGTLSANRDWVGSDPDFLVLYADVLTNVRLRPLIESHRKLRPAATIGLYQVPDPTRCGIVVFDAENRVTEFVEKPSQPRCNWAFSGVMVAGQSLLEYIPDTRPADIGFHVLPQLAEKMRAYPLADYLIDIGTLDNYERAQHTWPGLHAQDPSHFIAR